MAFRGYRRRHQGSRQRRARLRSGKVFRTRAGRLGRYVYRNGVRVGFKAVKSGARRYVADKTFRHMRKRWN